MVDDERGAQIDDETQWLAAWRGPHRQMHEGPAELIGEVYEAQTPFRPTIDGCQYGGR